MAYCPSCGSAFTKIRIENIILDAPQSQSYNGIVYSCPAPGCNAFLGVSVDPLALQNDIAQKVASALRKG